MLLSAREKDSFLGFDPISALILTGREGRGNLWAFKERKEEI